MIREEYSSAKAKVHDDSNIIFRNKSNSLIDQIVTMDHYDLRSIFFNNHSSGIYRRRLLLDFRKNHDKYLQE